MVCAAKSGQFHGSPEWFQGVVKPVERIGIANDRRPWRHSRISELVFELFESLVVSIRRMFRIVADDQLASFAKSCRIDTTSWRRLMIQQNNRPIVIVHRSVVVVGHENNLVSVIGYRLVGSYQPISFRESPPLRTMERFPPYPCLAGRTATGSTTAGESAQRIRVVSHW